MSLSLLSRAFAILRHFTVLFAVVSLLAPQAVHAGMSMDAEEVVADTIADGHHASVGEATTMDHGTSDACAGMICFYAMPLTMLQGEAHPIVILVENVLPQNVAPVGIDPATLRKPPKHA
ncbi:hypothetical protein AN189_06360 [Loktanella sp. 3ANDIMAR09]|uniref:hypothetical protein n=1 Tax=Loktanella sp. 3ANDIMAR09 TaxID=1225657 RepID=UPI0006F577A9|nr:hypothetical protein [Loktanella sp. 3ANDIMAR09]KQI69186.1 hypothetical protein AN189_06360 [Loktanella sp. 3ANDIMAR09]